MRIHTDADWLRFVALVQAPDPPEMPKRGHRITALGRPNRRADVGIPLLVRWYQTRIVMREEGQTR